MFVMKKWLEDNLSKIKQALFKTKSVLGTDTNTHIEEYIDVNDGLFEDLFEKLVKADVGADLSEEIVSGLRKLIKEKQITRNELNLGIKEAIKDKIKVSNSCFHSLASSLNICLIVGVNGSGKTTSIGKLAKRFKEEGAKVLIIAADTFRAAAQDQLSIWANRAEVEIYSPDNIKKPDAVVFSGIEKAKKENFSMVLIDTAGRLHSQTNLMDELKKINSVIEKQVVAIHELPLHYEKLIVLDATIGQNAISQAKQFSEAVKLTGIILAKLDSSARGGVVLNIMNELSIPVMIIGTGEKIDDLADFSFDEYLEGLLS